MKALNNIIDKAVDEYEDGETGLEECIERYCEERAVSSAMTDFLITYANIVEALGAGIPLAVVLGCRGLTNTDRLLAGMPLKEEK